jgi:MSHA biogenesis protein MshI
MAVVRRGDRIDLAHVIRAASGKPQIRLCDSFRIERDEADALQRLAQARNLKRYRCASLMAEGDYRLAQIDAPAVPEEERVQAVRWRLKDVVDFPVEDAALAVADIPAEGARQPSVFAIISPSTAVASRMALFSDAKLLLESLDIPEMALRNVAELFEETNRALAFLSVTEGESLLTVTFKGELFVARRIDLTARALADADPERRSQMLERLALELQRSLDNFDRQYGFVTLSGMVVASEWDAEAVVAALSENLYLPVKAMMLAEVMEFDDLPELRASERQAQALLAIGAALRTAA